MPKECNKGIIVPIYKNGDKRDCNNCRGVTFVSEHGQILVRTIEMRIKTKVDIKLDVLNV